MGDVGFESESRDGGSEEVSWTRLEAIALYMNVGQKFRSVDKKLLGPNSSKEAAYTPSTRFAHKLHTELSTDSTLQLLSETHYRVTSRQEKPERWDLGTLWPRTRLGEGEACE